MKMATIKKTGCGGFMASNKKSKAWLELVWNKGY
jgi:hypothetical protein